MTEKIVTEQEYRQYLQSLKTDHGKEEALKILRVSKDVLERQVRAGEINQRIMMQLAEINKEIEAIK
jgi:hypothetical protein